MTIKNDIRRVHVVYHSEDDGYWAESEDAPGWTAVGLTRSEVEQMAREGLRAYLDEEIIVVTESWPRRPVTVRPTITLTDESFQPFDNNGTDPARNTRYVRVVQAA